MERLMSKQHPLEESVPASLPAAATTKERFLPLPLVIVFIIILGAGLILFLTNDIRAENAAFKDISTCGATLVEEENGASDFYGVVQFKKNNEGIQVFLSQCEMRPEIALRVFNRALAGKSKDAKLVALHSAFFLAKSGMADAAETPPNARFGSAEFNEILKRIDPANEPDADVRKVAQRLVSSLTVLTNVKNEEKYSTLPSGLPELKENAPPYSITTRKERLGDADVLAVRWSNNDLALAWWKTHATGGVWDAKLKCFVIN
jgi:hypothetical protein